MPTEHETKVLDIDVEEIKKKLRELGAKEEKEMHMRRWIYDMTQAGDEWFRLRDDGNKITLTYKHRKGEGISETEEVEVEVEDFEKTAEIISKMNFKGKYYQENKRILFTLKDIEFCIDFWPKIPPLLEIESTSEEKVIEGLKMLGLKGKDIGNEGVRQIFKRYRIDMDKFKVLKF